MRIVHNPDDGCSQCVLRYVDEATWSGRCLATRNLLNTADVLKAPQECPLRGDDVVVSAGPATASPPEAAALKTPCECPLCNTMPDARGECLCYESMY